MSVYTSVSDDEIRQLLTRYPIGRFQSLHGIAQGITNSNFFLNTTEGSYVLTVFEALTEAELPFFMELTRHLSARGVACPAPVAQHDGSLTALIAGKPACIVTRLVGRDTAYPTAAQCRNTGAMLAKMHLAGADFPKKMANPRHAAWWEACARELLPLLGADDAALLRDETAFQAACSEDGLPQGIIHADLFKDNVLLEGENVAGFIDFYYACNGSFVYDLAIAVNDWARHADNRPDKALRDAFIGGYQSVRPLTEAETAAFPAACRAGALRFWVSRLWDYHFPAAGEITFIKDPNAFRDLLLHYRGAA